MNKRKHHAGKKYKNIVVPDDIHADLDVTYAFIDKWLPRNYSGEVNKILSVYDQVTPEYVRRVKTKKLAIRKIYTALYRIALFNKYQLDKISN